MKIRHKDKLYIFQSTPNAFQSIPDTLENLRKVIASDNWHGPAIPVDEQNISYNGRKLVGDKPLKDYNFPSDATILVQRYTVVSPKTKDAIYCVTIKDQFNNISYYYVEPDTPFSKLYLDSRVSYVSDNGFPANDNMVITNHTTFHAVPKYSSVLFVCTLTPYANTKSLQIDLCCVHYNQDTSVDDLKRQIENKTGIPIKDQKLLFRGNPIESIGSAQLKHCDEIHLECIEPDLTASVTLTVSRTSVASICVKSTLGSAFLLCLLKQLGSSSYIPDVLPSMKICLAGSLVIGALCTIGQYVTKEEQIAK